MGWLWRKRREEAAWSVGPARFIVPGLRELAVEVRVPAPLHPVFLRCCMSLAADLAGEVSGSFARTVEAKLARNGAGVVAGSVGWVGLPPRETPLLLAMAPRRDLVAARVAAAMAGGRLAAMRHLWLALAPGVFLGQIVDPDRCLEADLSEVLLGLASGAVHFAVLVTTALEHSAVGYSFRVLGRPGTLCRVVHLARDAFSVPLDRASTANPAIAITP